MPTKMILVVDDEQDIRELISYNLVKDGYQVECAGSGEEALRQVLTSAPDLITLDLMLPGMDGLEVCRRLKANSVTARIPIVIISVKDEAADIVASLELGADDFVIKPFNSRVLLARIRAVLRRDEGPPNNEEIVLRHGEIVIDPTHYEVAVNGQPILLTKLEMRILLALARRPRLALTRHQIINDTQGQDADVTERSVDVHLVSLRRKLGDHGKLIETVRGVGFRLKDQ